MAEGLDGAGDSYQISNPQLDRVIAVVREYCLCDRTGVKKGGNLTPGARAHARASAAMAIYNVGERDIGTVSVILASFGILAANMTDIDAMGIPDAEGDPTTSSDGRKKYRAESYCPIWVFADQAFYRNMIYEKDPLGLGKKLKINIREIK